MLSTLSWWVAIQVIAMAALPLSWRLFVRLPGRGYPLAKALGLLLVSFVLWLGATFRLLPNNMGGVLFALLIVAGLSAWLGRDALSRSDRAGQDGASRRPLFAWLRENWGVVLATELLFIVVFAAWTAFRAYNPDIAGTEKPMELAFINGTLRSRFFPPQDPWLSGYGISYYYFGYLMLSALIHLTGVDPAVGFNLGVGLWYALVMIGAFALVFDLVGLAGRARRAVASAQGDDRTETGRGVRYGLLGAVFVGFLSNLEGLVELAYNMRLVPLEWIRWLDIKQLTDAPPSGGWTGGFWWWWHASRVVHDKDLLGNSVEVIDEFPLFSFLLGDMHPHVLALPFVLLAIALGLNLMLGARDWVPGVRPAEQDRREPEDRDQVTEGSGAEVALAPSSQFRHRLQSFWLSLGEMTGLGVPGIFLYSVVLGALAFLNTWDFPIYLALVALALAAGLALRGGLSGGVLTRAVGAGLTFGVLGVAAYLPFYLGFQSQLGGILPNLLFPTRLSQYLLMFAPLLLIVVFFLVQLSREAPQRDLRRGFAGVLPWTLIAPLVLMGLLYLSLTILPQGRSFLSSVLDNPAVKAALGDRTANQLAGLALRIRAATPWTYLFLALFIAWVGGLLWAALGPDHSGTDQEGAEGSPGGGTEDAGRPGTPRLPTDAFILIMVGLALLLTFAVEFVYLRDLFSTRMNTVFKFYYQAWILLALAAAYAVSRLAERRTPALLRVPALLLCGLLVLGGLYYPVAAIPSKADNFRGRPTLDGLAYLRNSNPADMAAIDWIRANLPGDATVLEASGGSYSPEGAGRVSMSTGNPTLLGWDFHEMQWRGQAYDRLAQDRPAALEQIYRTAHQDDLPGLLDRWGIKYVIVGALEKRKYGMGDAALARFDRSLKRVYDKDGITIYAR